MKKSLTFIVAVLILNITFLFAQEKENDTYVFLNATATHNVEQYVIAFSTADMTKFRFEDKRNVIEFENGLKVELFSANELIQKGYEVDNRKLLTSAPLYAEFYTFDLSADGKTILQKFTKTKIKH